MKHDHVFMVLLSRIIRRVALADVQLNIAVESPLQQWLWI